MQPATHSGPRRTRGTAALLLLLGAAAGLVAWQLTPHSLRRTSPDGFPAPPEWTPLSTAEAVLHRETAVAACERQLQEIGRALARCRQERGRLPDQLSDLVPRYLPDRSLLHCPADPTPGAPGLPDLHQDPRLPCSYSYEATGDPGRWVQSPLRPLFLASALPDDQYPGYQNYGTCRHVNEYLQTFFGGWVPAVRCWHH